MRIAYYFQKIEYGSPQFDDAIRLRYQHLRKPLKLFFSVEDILCEVSHYHFGLYSLYTDALIACASLVLEETGEQLRWKMRQVVVAEEYRGHGFGRVLIEALETFAQAKNGAYIYCHARKVVKDFYIHLGYTPTGKTFQEVKLPHIRMEKVLSR